MPNHETAESITDFTNNPKDVPGVSQSHKPGSIKKLSEVSKKEKMKKNGLIILGVVVGGIIILGLAYLFGARGDGILRSPLGGDSNLSSGGTVVNPLTGELVSAAAAQAWQNVRPLAVMVNNHVDARPQSGLIYADLVYEIVAEGGITRMMPFFLSNIPEKIGPVRSTREYYLVLVKELGDAMLMHIGWSPQALEAIETWPVRSLGRGGGQFWRDTSLNVATEHTAYVNGKDLLQVALDLGWEGTRPFQVWQFKDEAGEYDLLPSASHVTIDFWYPGEYSAEFDYDAASNEYLRFFGYDEADNPIPHVDRETNQQIRVKNLIVQFVTETSIAGDEKGRLFYEFERSGSGLVFIDGKVINVTWSKAGRDERTMFYDLNGEEIKFNRGKFWISVVPDRNVDQVVYN